MMMSCGDVNVQGLVVPVLRNVETMNYSNIELAINELGVKVKGQQC